MSGGLEAYEVVDLGADRGMTRDLMKVAAARHNIHGLLELDVTEARHRLGALSMTAFLIHCYASALAAEPRVNSRAAGRRLYCFSTVNVGTTVERVDENGRKTVAGLVVRDAAAKSVESIHREIREAQHRPVAELAKNAGVTPFRLMPGFVRRWALRYLLSRPVTAHRMGLVAGVSAVGMFTKGAGWGLPLALNTTMLTVGGIGRRPVLVNGAIEEHEFLSITLSFDHDIIDGAPAARFAARLRELVEAADGLDRQAAADTLAGCDPCATRSTSRSTAAAITAR